jgi:hypothetical protein
MFRASLRPSSGCQTAFHCLWFSVLVTVHTSHHPTLQDHNYNRTENHRQWNAVRPPDDGPKDARNMLRNNWLIINHYLLHLVGLTFIYTEKYRTRQVLIFDSQQICIRSHKFESIMDDIEAKDLWYGFVTEPCNSLWVDTGIRIARCGSCLTLSFISSVSHTWLWRQVVYRMLLETLFYDLVCYAFSVRCPVLSITWFIFSYKANYGLPSDIHCTFVVSLWCYPTIWQFLCPNYWQADSCR